MKKIFLFIIITTIFSQDNKSDNTQNQNLFSMKGFKIGLDLSSEIEVSSSEDISVSYDLDPGIALSMEFYTSNAFDIGIEYLNKTDIDSGSGSVSHLSFYALYSFFNDDKMNLKAKFGYSTLDLGDNSSDYYSSSINEDGGFMYGLQLELVNGIHISYTIHDGEYSSSVYDYDSLSLDTSTKRFNI
jgi:hypothetical protein